MNKFSLAKIKQYLVSKQKEVAKKIKSLEEEESLFNDGTPESSELGSFAWEADLSSTKLAIKRQLLMMAENLHLALLKLQKGTYGRCDKCQRNIEKERLEVIPTANLCVACVN